MQSKLSDLINKLSEVYKRKKKSKACMERKKKESECDFVEFKNNRLNYKCKECKKRSFKSINGSIKNRPIWHPFYNGDLNKFVLLLRKDVYPYEYMDSWERFDEESLVDKKAFYSKLNLDDITDNDYEHCKKVWEVFEMKNLGEYHDFYVQCDRLPLADVFENTNWVMGFKWVKIYPNLMSASYKIMTKAVIREGYFLEVDVEYLKKLFNLHEGFSYLPKREKIKKCEKFICNIRDKKMFFYNDMQIHLTHTTSD